MTRSWLKLNLESKLVKEDQRLREPLKYPKQFCMSSVSKRGHKCEKAWILIHFSFPSTLNLQQFIATDGILIKESWSEQLNHILLLLLTNSRIFYKFFCASPLIMIMIEVL